MYMNAPVEVSCYCVSSVIFNVLVYLFLRTVPEWINPAQYNLVVVTSSEGRNLPYGKLEDIISRENAALNCHTNDDK